MKRTLFLLGLTIVLLTFEGLALGAANVLKEGEPISVITRYGEVVGKLAKVGIASGNSTNDVYVRVFQGIPFAKPPIGERRFKPPTEPEPWLDELSALKPSKSCSQLGRNDSSIESLDTSEDCLYLNVWVPLSIPKGDAAAVMVWIYGGAFSMGTTNRYDFERFSATEGVIVVSANYRVSSLGFLYFGDEDCPGNMGLMDQRLALKWVRDNVDRFGGDPEKVTVFGQSAGSVSSSFHLLNPHSQKLFKRAILQSGPPGSPWASDVQSEALNKSSRVARQVGCGNDLSNVKKTLECLRKVDARLLVEASASLGDILTLYHRPVVDNRMVFESPSTTVHAIEGKEVILGFTSNDCGFIVNALVNVKQIAPKDIFREYVKKYLGEMDEDVSRLVRYYYEDHCDDVRQFREEKATVRLGTDLYFTCAATDLADQLSEARIKTFVYQWNHRPLSSQSPAWIEADHSSENQFILGNPEALRSLREEELSRRIMRYWANFAKHGNPNEENDGERNPKMEPWPVYASATKARLDINLDSSVQALGAIRDNHCHFWKRLYPLISGQNPIKH